MMTAASQGLVAPLMFLCPSADHMALFLVVIVLNMFLVAAAVAGGVVVAPAVAAAAAAAAGACGRSSSLAALNQSHRAQTLYVAEVV